MRISLFAAALVALPLLAACGGSSSDKSADVTQADVSKALQDGGLKDAKLADCAAKIYVGQGISQSGLRLMIKNDAKSAAAQDPESLGMSKDDADKARAATTKIVTDCLKQE
ncbi:hypothetical protein [Nocardia seriolae]|uniref:DUF732 domain-containing protein n=1 Tax=Nocardia seriolae TaxID=37332 RepID=A0A0B8N4K4_9NOCA|nr:hypothetical protein [Nocardia seriolae]APA95146.1 hypothetical protein NS506_01072 [Nocardia seriolae]MTJ66756.1 hypothetical protein [Nocardia seriolae]MTJ70446.1 hypothetical protein [Nocardia seriolae]MTJ85408.1 hypothetical protein [Nocardia seriolae]MTK29405.1 hypothetical protein [Nocardia seriolae]